MSAARPRPAWPGQAAHGQHRGAVFQGEIAFAGTHRHQQRQVAVGAQGTETELAQVVAIGRLVDIHQRDEGFAADIGRAWPAASLLAGQAPLLAADDVVGLLAAITQRIADRIERLERLLGAAAMAGDLGQGMNLEIQRPGAVGDHLVLMHSLAQVNAIGAAWKQVHRRGAEGHELGRRHRAFQGAVEAIEQHHQLQFLAAAALHTGAQPGEVDEQEAVGQGEILLQQAIPLEGPGHHRQHRVLIVEAARFEALQRQALGPVAVEALDEYSAGVAEQLLVQTERLLVGAVEVERQAVQRQGVERQPGTAAQAQAQPGLGLGFAGGQPAEGRRRVAEVFGMADLQRPQRHRMGATVFAGGLLAMAQLAAQGGMAFDPETAGQ